MFRIKEAASLLGVSTDTLRRWADAGRIPTTTDASGRMAVEGTALATLAQELAESADHEQNQVVVAHSTRNRFSGLISRVTRDTVMAQVEIQAVPVRVTAQPRSGGRTRPGAGNARGRRRQGHQRLHRNPQEQLSRFPACQSRVLVAPSAIRSTHHGLVPCPVCSAALARHIRRHHDNASRPTVPAVLVNFGGSADFPLLLGGVVALCGLAALTHLLVVSVARRRTESGLLMASAWSGARSRRSCLAGHYSRDSRDSRDRRRDPAEHRRRAGPLARVRGQPRGSAGPGGSGLAHRGTRRRCSPHR